MNKTVIIVGAVLVVTIIIILLCKKSNNEGYDGMVKISGPYGTDGGKYIGKKFADFGCGNGGVPCALMTPDDYGKLSIFQRNWSNMVEWKRMASIDYINQGGGTLNGYVAPLHPVLTTMGKEGGVPGGDGSNNIGSISEPIPSPGTIGLDGSVVPSEYYRVKQAEDAIADVYSYYYDTGDSTATADKIKSMFRAGDVISKLVVVDIFQGFDTTQHMNMWREWALIFANMIADLSPQYYKDDAARNALVTTIYTAMVDHIEMTRDQIWQYRNGNLEKSLEIYTKLQGQTIQFSNMLFELMIQATN